jgi:hypothetical protein
MGVLQELKDGSIEITLIFSVPDATELETLFCDPSHRLCRRM